MCSYVCAYVCAWKFANALQVGMCIVCVYVRVCRGVIECITDVTSKQSPCWGHINMSKDDKARWKALKEILPLEVCT